MDNIIFRKSVKEDIPYVNNLFIQMVRTVNERMKKSGVEPYTDFENGFEDNYLDKFYVDDSNVIFIAEDNNKVIGFISVINHKDYKYIYLDDYCVSEEYRGRGIGSKLIDKAFDFAKEHQIDQVITHVENANKESIEFYKHKGFKLVEEQGHRLLIRRVANHLSEEEQMKLFGYNNAIIKKVIDKINIECPETIDMIGISGSFCSGLFHKKSDLDLLIVANGNADVISKCYIFDGIGQDIYYRQWNDLENMAEYKSMFVTKLKDLNIIYYKDIAVLEKYNELQDKLNNNMNNDEKIKITVDNYLAKVVDKANKIKITDDLSECYKLVGSMMNDIENIIFINNKRYLYGGTKNILAEMSTMINLPDNFVNEYKRILELTNIDDIKLWVERIVNILGNYFKYNININILNNSNESFVKRDITKNDLIGSYEELYSNYYNKLLYAVETNNKFLSFRTMIDAQGFFDEFTSQFNMPEFNLLKNYNPNDLKANALEFERLLNKWKKLYDLYEIEVECYDSIDELYDSKGHGKI